MKDKLLKLLGLKEDATDDAIVAGVEELRRTAGGEHAGARVEGKTRVLKAIAKHAGLDIDWSELKGDDEALSALAVEMGVKLKGARGTKPGDGKAGKSGNGDEGGAGDDAAAQAQAAAEAQAKVMAPVQDSYIVLELQKRGIFNADLVPVVLQSLKRDKLTFTKAGEAISGVTIPDEEITRLHKEMPSVFKQGVDILSPKPAAGGGTGESSAGDEVANLHKKLTDRAATSVLGKAKQA